VVATSAKAVGAAIAAHGRGDGEQRGPDDEGALAADGVTQAAAQQHQPAKGQQVGGDHQAPPGVRQAQLDLDLGKRDDRDGAVHRRQQLHAADRGNRGDEPATRQGCWLRALCRPLRS
jgi:hypothetical protein